MPASTRTRYGLQSDCAEPRGSPLAIGAVLALLSCHPSTPPPCSALQPSTPIAEDGGVTSCVSATTTWIDLGYPPTAATPTALAASGEFVYLGTKSGVWRGSLASTSSWTQLSLTDQYVRGLTAAGSWLLAGLGRDDGLSFHLLPVDEPAVFARSADWGHSWCTSGGPGFTEVVSGLRFAIPMEQVVRDPGSEGGGLGLIFGALSGSTVVASADGGATWTTFSGQRALFGGSPCVLAVSQDPGRRLLQGCELPADIAWIRSFDLAARSLVGGAPVELVGADVIGNRRPNSFGGGSVGGVSAYAGLEGGLGRFDPGGWAWVWQHPSDGSAGFGNYAYVRVVWVDPCDDRHLVFGGPTQARSTFDLYETFDGGATLGYVPPPSLPFPAVVERGAPAGTGGRSLAIVVSMSGSAPYRVLVRAGTDFAGSASGSGLR